MLGLTVKIIEDAGNRLNAIIDKLDPETLRKVVVEGTEEKLRTPSTFYSQSNNRNFCLQRILRRAYLASGELNKIYFPAFKTGVHVKNIVFTRKIHQKTMSFIKK